jgi:3D (Asp-Asp-Asp) domain-containing protein
MAEFVAALLLFCYAHLGWREPYTEPATPAAEQERRSENVSSAKDRSTVVTATAYSPTVEECDETPFITASGRRVRPGIIALSRDIEREFGVKFGDVLYLEGLGYYEFQDRMHWRWKRRVDIFLPTPEGARHFGLIRNVKIYFPRKAVPHTTAS